MNLHFDVKGLVSIKTIEKKLRWYHEQFVLMDGLFFSFRRRDIMESSFYHFIWFALFFIVVYVVYFFMLKSKLKRKKEKTIGEISYLIRKFHLDVRKIDYWKMILPISLINAFIISFVATVIMLFPVNMIWQLLIGFVLLFFLIYAIYEIYGRHLVKKYGKN